MAALDDKEPQSNTSQPNPCNRRDFSDGPDIQTIQNGIRDEFNIGNEATVMPRALNGKSGPPGLCRKTLPPGTKPTKFVGEGAANAVFEIQVPQDNTQTFKGLLLRMAKVPKLGQQSDYDYMFQQKFFKNTIKPMLGSYAVDHQLVLLRDSGIVDQLNQMLGDMNHSRRTKFRDTYIGQSEWGFLIQDMRPRDDETTQTLVEFKPKWLSQSPSAPKNAIRCRQCALELQHLVTKPAGDRSSPDQKPCPLAIGNPDAPDIVAWPFRIAPKLAAKDASGAYEQGLKQIVSHPALKTLKQQQDLHDSVGPLKADPSSPEFAIAMTIRDCTCFARISEHDTSNPPELRFGDLDWKDPLVKFDHWYSTERALVDGGFYTADWILCDGEYYHSPTICLLEWTSNRQNDIAEVLNMHRKGVTNGTTSANPRLYGHTTNVDALKERLEGYEREPEGTPNELLRNPFRCKLN